MTVTTCQTIQRESTRELVLSAQAGDREAFGVLFQRFERQVFALALARLGDYSDAQELCQDVFVQALEKISQLREPACFGGWLRAIARRMAINRAVRRRPAAPVAPESLEAGCVENATPLEAAIEGERFSRLRASLGRLRSLDRETLVAFYFEGRSLLQMSDEFGAPLGTIKRRLHVARKRLAKEVESLLAV